MTPELCSLRARVIVHLGVVFELVANALFEGGLELPHLRALGAGMLPELARDWVVHASHVGDSFSKRKLCNGNENVTENVVMELAMPTRQSFQSKQEEELANTGELT